MKKLLMLLMVTVVCQSCSWWEELQRREEEEQRRQREMMFMLGFGKTTIVDPSTGETSYVDPVGAQLGIEAKVVAFNENSFLSTGLNVTFQGADYVDPGVSGTVKLTYLNLPLLYTYGFGKNFYAEAGLQPGLLISAKDKYNGESYNYKDNVHKFELGLPVGVGYNFNNHFGLDLRATYGLTNIDTDSGNDHNLLVVGMVRYSIGW